MHVQSSIKRSGQNPESLTEMQPFYRGRVGYFPDLAADLHVYLLSCEEETSAQMQYVS